MSNNNHEIEYDDVYIVEEKSIKVDELEDNMDTELKENLTLDSLELSDEEDDVNITNDFDKLKVTAEILKKKLQKQSNNVNEFKPKVIQREEVVEDFIRNFFTQHNLLKTLDEFNVTYHFN